MGLQIHYQCGELTHCIHVPSVGYSQIFFQEYSSRNILPGIFLLPINHRQAYKHMIHTTEVSTPYSLWAPTASDLTANPCHVRLTAAASVGKKQHRTIYDCGYHYCTQSWIPLSLEHSNDMIAHAQQITLGNNRIIRIMGQFWEFVFWNNILKTSAQSY